jgi:hypothetical protein
MSEAGEDSGDSKWNRNGERDKGVHSAF